MKLHAGHRGIIRDSVGTSIIGVVFTARPQGTRGGRGYRNLEGKTPVQQAAFGDSVTLGPKDIASPRRLHREGAIKTHNLPSSDFLLRFSERMPGYLDIVHEPFEKAVHQRFGTSVLILLVVSTSTSSV